METIFRVVNLAAFLVFGFVAIISIAPTPGVAALLAIASFPYISTFIAAYCDAGNVMNKIAFALNGIWAVPLGLMCLMALMWLGGMGLLALFLGIGFFISVLNLYLLMKRINAKS